MLSVTRDWNPRQKRLSTLLSAADGFEEGIGLCREMHNELHDMLKEAKPTIFQTLLQGLEPEMIRYRPPKSFSSIAWDIWHITRIEDAVSNILIADSEQVLDADWVQRLGVSITDTGNALSTEGVDELGRTIDTAALLKYRKAVGQRTQKVIKGITEADRKRKPTESQLRRILSEKILTHEKDSIWLMDFWGNKTISGLLLMPITRHQVVHINDCFKLKNKYLREFA
jgi:hypothetical protein